MRKLIILEINEVPFKVFDHYVDNYPDTCLSKILTSSVQYQTMTTDKGELHPWSTWSTFYRGVDNTIHRIKDIGEDLSERDQKYPPIWKILVEEGIISGVFASLHTHPLPNSLKGYAYLVPDPFANDPSTHPKKIESFQAFNLAMSKKSGRNVDKKIDKQSALKLILNLPFLGIRLKTIFNTFMQLVDEKFSPWKVSRRRTFQSILAFDIFLKLLKKHKPEFTTFFSNHVASAMHRYWAATFPNEYIKNDLPKEWIDQYANEIPHCMDQFNDMVKSIHTFIKKNPEYKLIIASSMGQQATKAVMVYHELFLSDTKRFIHKMGKLEMKALSAMHPQYNFSVPEEEAEKLESTLTFFKINGTPIKFRRKGKTFFSIDLGYPNIENFNVEINGESTTIDALGLEVKKIDDQSGGTAYHIPKGSFFIYDIGNLKKTTERMEVDLREVAPSILNFFNLKKRSYMKEGKIKI